jgi:hypothetical protein
MEKTITGYIIQRRSLRIHGGISTSTPKCWYFTWPSAQTKLEWIAALDKTEMGMTTLTRSLRETGSTSVISTV